MPVDHRERAFEAAIEDCLLTRGGYATADPANFDRQRAIDPTVLIPFLKETQPETWESLEKLHGSDTEGIVLDDLCKAMDSQGSLAVIRHGFKCFGKLIRVAYFAPAHRMNPDTERLYAANRLTVTRQLHYSTKNENSIDVVLGLNGIPVVTAELKNPMSGQRSA
jgi:type I restriction enzyme R subunit